MQSVEFSREALSHLSQWILEDRKVASKIMKLITEISKTPFSGTGKPEALKYNYKGLWSRRITDEHRLIYEVNQEKIKIISCKNHYEDK